MKFAIPLKDFPYMVSIFAFVVAKIMQLLSFQFIAEVA